MATPAVVPTSNRQPTTAVAPSDAGVVAAFVPNPAFRSFLNQIIENVRNGLSQRRPWRELVDRSALSKPESLSEATLRIRKNYAYFRTNYYVIIAAVIGLSLLSNPFTLCLLLALLAAWLFLYVFRPVDQPLVIFGRVFSDFEILAALILSTVLVLFLTSVGPLLVTSLLVSVAIVCAHSVFRVPEDFYFEEQQAQAQAPPTGIISLLTGAATKAAAAPAAASRV
ncbi:PREDICTED: PRA1 family protein B4-like [Ipomoea nil]|uniref:PRA1 family protein B4-like n=1 Tax=Ipomoea nil TaxID=35883 RepID=UPI00090126FC|nr:PREDICTED: PRA1 family protein B4-like [Ipomoea nil]